MGLCKSGKVLQRDSAVPGDGIYVTGDLGDAAIGLKALSARLEDEQLQPCIEKLNRPEARVRFAEQLVNYSKCAIDVSDGLVADLGHITESSQCGARIMLSDIPLSASARYYFKQYNDDTVDWSLLLAQGDDYELCFTRAKDNEFAAGEIAKKHDLKISCIGEITALTELIFISGDNETVSFIKSGYGHF